jgi:hypothetical protein
MLSETRERLARVIVAQVPIETIEEIHFFQPIRQGGVESGVAVVAAAVAVAMEESPRDGAEGAEIVESRGEGDAGGDAVESRVEGDAGDACVDVPAHVVEPPDDWTVSEDFHAEESASSGVEPDVAPEPEPPVRRFTVYTARYRLTLKGPDRGKWDANVVAEADAPLATIDAVVRGVLRRAGDAEEAERMSGAELEEALRQVSASATESRVL